MANPLNTDLSTPGFTDGHRDGKAGKEKNYTGQLKHLKTWLWGNPAMDSYSRSYDQGHSVGQAESRAVFSTTTSHQSTQPSTGGRPMARQTSLAHQIELLENLKSYLMEFQERLIGVSANYERKLDNLYSEGGMIDEFHARYMENAVVPVQEKIRELVDQIEGNDLPAVRQLIEYLQEGQR